MLTLEMSIPARFSQILWHFCNVLRINCLQLKFFYVDLKHYSHNYSQKNTKKGVQCKLDAFFMVVFIVYIINND